MKIYNNPRGNLYVVHVREADATSHLSGLRLAGQYTFNDICNLILNDMLLSH
jgi:hypothetical protein